MPAAPLPPDEGERLAALKALGILDTPPSPELDIFPIMAQKMFGTPIAAISLIDKDRQWFKSRIGPEMAEADRAVAFCAHAILNPHEVLCVADATQDSRFADNPLVTGPLGLRFYAGAPILGPKGHALGTLCVAGTEPRQIPPSRLDLLKHLALGVGSALKLHEAERAMHKALMREMESHRFFAATFIGIDAAVALVTDSGQILTSNPAFQKLLGYTADELRGLCIDELMCAGHHAMVTPARARQAEDGQRYEIMSEARQKAGNRLTVRMTSTVLQDGNHRLRVKTLIPVQPDTPLPMPFPVTMTPYARDVGQLRAVSLEAFRALFGADWERIAERAFMRAEQIVRRRLDRDDVVSRVDEKFIIWFQSRDQDRNEETLNKIVRDIRIRFTTEFGEETAKYVDSVLVPGGAPPAAPAEPAPRPARPGQRAEQPQAVGWLG